MVKKAGKNLSAALKALPVMRGLQDELTWRTRYPADIFDIPEGALGQPKLKRQVTWNDYREALSAESVRCIESGVVDSEGEPVKPSAEFRAQQAARVQAEWDAALNDISVLLKAELDDDADLAAAAAAKAEALAAAASTAKADVKAGDAKKKMLVHHPVLPPGMPAEHHEMMKNFYALIETNRYLAEKLSSTERRLMRYYTAGNYLTALIDVADSTYPQRIAAKALDTAEGTYGSYHNLVEGPLTLLDTISRQYKDAVGGRAPLYGMPLPLDLDLTDSDPELPRNFIRRRAETQATSHQLGAEYIVRNSASFQNRLSDGTPSNITAMHVAYEAALTRYMDSRCANRDAEENRRKETLEGLQLAFEKALEEYKECVKGTAERDRQYEERLVTLKSYEVMQELTTARLDCMAECLTEKVLSRTQLWMAQTEEKVTNVAHHSMNLAYANKRFQEILEAAATTAANALEAGNACEHHLQAAKALRRAVRFSELDRPPPEARFTFPVTRAMGSSMDELEAAAGLIKAAEKQVATKRVHFADAGASVGAAGAPGGDPPPAPAAVFEGASVGAAGAPGEGLPPALPLVPPAPAGGDVVPDEVAPGGGVPPTLPLAPPAPAGGDVVPDVVAPGEGSPPALPLAPLVEGATVEGAAVGAADAPPAPGGGAFPLTQPAVGGALEGRRKQKEDRVEHGLPLSYVEAGIAVQAIRKEIKDDVRKRKEEEERERKRKEEQDREDARIAAEIAKEENTRILRSRSNK